MIKVLARLLLSPQAKWRINQHRHLMHLGPTPLIQQCCICDFTGYFSPFGWPVRPNALCPNCCSLERHRLMKLWLDANPAMLRGKTILHFAAEAALRQLLESTSFRYMSADINPTGDDIALDIESIDQPENTFDMIICSHVLEKVDDKAALGELNRILKPGGLLLVMIPIVEGWSTTYEMRPLTSGVERQWQFGEFDDLRLYGADFRGRLTSAGFTVSTFTGTPEQTLRFSLLLGESLFIAKKES